MDRGVSDVVGRPVSGGGPVSTIARIVCVLVRPQVQAKTCSPASFYTCRDPEPGDVCPEPRGTGINRNLDASSRSESRSRARDEEPIIRRRPLSELEVGRRRVVIRRGLASSTPVSTGVSNNAASVSAQRLDRHRSLG